MLGLLTFTFIILLSRFAFLRENKATCTLHSICRTIGEWAFTICIFRGSTCTFILCAIIGALNFTITFFERGSRKIDKSESNPDLRSRAITALLIIIPLGLIPYYPEIEKHISLEVNADLSKYLSPIIIIYGCGILLCMKEGNYIIKMICDALKLGQKIKKTTNTGNGRYIGISERVLFFVFLLLNMGPAVTFIAAVKGFARFKHMEEDEAFGEYVVIGTFLSMLFTAIIFSISRHWLKIIPTP